METSLIINYRTHNNIKWPWFPFRKSGHLVLNWLVLFNESVDSEIQLLSHLLIS